MDNEKSCSNCKFWNCHYGCTNVNSEGFHKIILNSKEAYCDAHKGERKQQWTMTNVTPT